MKYLWSILLTPFAFLPLSAQNTVKMSAVKGNNFGVAYSLPKSAISITANYTKTTRKAGEFYQYAERFLNISNPITKNEVVYTLNDVGADVVGIPDKENSYLVEFKSNSVAPFVTLTQDGVICAINAEYLFEAAPKPKAEAQKPDALPNPKSLLSEEILRAGSTSKQAELIAKQIYLLRETRTNILTGEADNMPPDGNAYKLVMEQLDKQEKALTSMFAGTEETESGSKTFSVVPDEANIDRRIIFRFSSKLGIVAEDNLAGSPVYLTLTNQSPQEEVFLSEKDQKTLDKKFSAGIIYNVPSKGNLKIEYNNKTLVQKVCDIVQFGIQEVLAPKELDSGKQPIKITFYPELGAIKEITR
ncbi:hypothetical protein M2132_002312 [Dysgonomonas sp. PH5-45]|uniref:DUF4831 family protein n=1 Tax=unclassified Dysgonomonas TaxID=2630389 RepID=UPI002473AF82|nr:MULTISPECIES: DUF4831 family protein [unclassified Dysgonomonas]MDH6355961.1 hypothetical protein [Dysgonomonas sp. PH5-45]MDH6388856.1 hypothetical protein [Dysgonomonas sp. PH5-37]